MNSNNFNESRYSRFVPLPSIGTEGMKKIRKARATVVGCGGLGSVTAFQLTALGIGFLRIIDGDIVELSNLQRQTLYREKDIGKPKVKVASNFLKELNPDVEIEAIEETIVEDNAKLASEKVDFIVDALDKFTPRFVLSREALKRNLFFLFGAVNGFNGNAMTCTRGAACIECLFSHVDEALLPSSAEIGIHPTIIQIIGSIQIAEATKIMLGYKPYLINKLLFCDIESMQFEVIPLLPKDNCTCRTF